MTAGIIQARCGSTRLPRKVLKDLMGRPMLTRVVERVRESTTLDTLVVATTNAPEDDAILHLCETLGVLCVRGNDVDVLDRYYGAAMAVKADVIVRITADCPLIDGSEVDRVVSAFIHSSDPVDYAANVLPPRTFPRGLDTEVFSFAALQDAWRQDTNSTWREHVTPYLYRTGKFRVLAVFNDSDFSGMRWTVDTPEDLEFVRLIYGHFGNQRFGWRDVLELLRRNPGWQLVNRDVAQASF